MRIKPIKRVPGEYYATEDGRIFNGDTGREIKQQTDKAGYFIVSLPIGGGKKKHFRVNRLVCEAFNGPFDESLQVDHKNRDKTDNRASNLRAVTPRVNAHNKYTGTSGLRGVSYNKARNKWVASIHILGKTRYLGIFPTAAAAEFAYKTALSNWEEDGKLPEEKTRTTPEGMKHCSGCNRDLPYSDFYYIKKYNHYTALCRECHKAEMKRRRAANKEKDQ